MEDLETIREFLIESNENLLRLEQEIVELERSPDSAELVASIFRTFHTLKGSCGYLGFEKLMYVSHAAETVLTPLREGTGRPTTMLLGLLREAADAIRELLAVIEATGREGSEEYRALIDRLEGFALRGELAEAAPTASQAREEAATTVQSGGTVRVDGALLEKLTELVSELMLARNLVLEHGQHCRDAAFAVTSRRLDRITADLQEGVMKTRLLPVGVMWSRLPRLVRDLAAELGKEIELVMEGAETELDTRVLEAIRDPLTHIVRNSCDHGIETPQERALQGKSAGGLLTLRAFEERGRVTIEVSDDGKGLDVTAIQAKALAQGLLTAEQAARMSARETMRTIFAPGFSTAERVSLISGRGVGMDIVKTSIERIGGVVELESGVGRTGTTVKMTLPLSTALATRRERTKESFELKEDSDVTVQEKTKACC